MGQPGTVVVAASGGTVVSGGRVSGGAVSGGTVSGTVVSGVVSTGAGVVVVTKTQLISGKLTVFEELFGCGCVSQKPNETIKIISAPMVELRGRRNLITPRPRLGL